MDQSSNAFVEYFSDQLVALVSTESHEECEEIYQQLFNDVNIARIRSPLLSNNLTFKNKGSVEDHNTVHVPTHNIKKKVEHWNLEEHRLFLQGLKNYGQGKWKAISKHIVTKTSKQVASHAQKYFIRQAQVDATKKKRTSILDTTQWDGKFHPLLYKDYNPTTPNGEMHQIN